MRILVGIPVVNGYLHTKNAIESVLSQADVELLLIDNGADDEIKGLFKTYSDNKRVHITVNSQNIYVNPAWNQIVKLFLSSEYDLLVIMNSDLVLQKDWSLVLTHRINTFRNESYLPTVIQDVTKVNDNVDIKNSVAHIILEGAAGIFITLTKEQAKLVYPINEDCLVWYGDNWIYEILRGCGHNTVSLNNLIAHHGISQTISRIPSVSMIITFDQRVWPEVQLKIKERIERNKGQQPAE